MSVVWIVGNSRRTSMPRGWTGLTGHREESWSWRLLDLADNMVGILDGVQGGNLSFNVHADTRGTGSLSWAGLTTSMPDWLTYRVQPVYHAQFNDGIAVEWPMGVFLPSTPAVQYGDAHASASVTLYDKTLVLRQDELDADYGLPKGSNVVAAVRSIVAASVGGQVVVDDSDETLRTAMFWEAGTSRLRVVNDLLDAAGFFALWADGAGVLRSAPYSPPLSRPVVWDFADGPTSIYDPGFTVTRDAFDVPNKVIGLTRGDGDDPALRSVATIDEVDAAHPYSAASRGRVITRFEDGIEATSQSVLDTKVRRLRDEALQTSSTVELSHAPLPLTGNDHVTFTRSTADVRFDGVVQAVRFDTTPGALWATTVQEVRS